MTSPTNAMIRIDAMLTNMSIAYAQSAGFVADRVFPTIPVNLESGKYAIFSKADFNRDDAQLRAPGTFAAETGWTSTFGDYQTKGYASRWKVPDEMRANYRLPLDVDMAAARLLNTKMRIKRERAFAAAFMAAGLWGNTDQTGVASAPAANQFLQWNDAASTPLEDIAARQRVVQLNCGFLPNVLVLGPRVYDALRLHPDIKGYFVPSRPGGITSSDIASLLNVEEVFVAEGSYNTAQEGATASMSRIVGDTALLVYRAPSPSLDTPSGGYTFSWTPFDMPGLSESGASAMLPVYREEGIHSDWYEARSNFVQKITAADAGQFFISAVAA